MPKRNLLSRTKFRSAVEALWQLPPLSQQEQASLGVSMNTSVSASGVVDSRPSPVEKSVGHLEASAGEGSEKDSSGEENLFTLFTDAAQIVSKSVFLTNEPSAWPRGPTRTPKNSIVRPKTSARHRWGLVNKPSAWVTTLSQPGTQICV